MGDPDNCHNRTKKYNEPYHIHSNMKHGDTLGGSKRGLPKHVSFICSVGMCTNIARINDGPSIHELYEAESILADGANALN